LISAKNRVDLSSISEVRSYITEWPRFFGPPCIHSYKMYISTGDVHFWQLGVVVTLLVALTKLIDTELG